MCSRWPFVLTKLWWHCLLPLDSAQRINRSLWKCNESFLLIFLKENPFENVLSV